MSRKAAKNSSKPNCKVKEQYSETIEVKDDPWTENIKQENEANFEIILDEVEGKTLPRSS